MNTERLQKYITTVNQSIDAEFVGRHYTTRPGAPAGSVKSTIKKYILESFSKCTGISNIMKVRWKSVPGGWTGVEEATFTKSCSCSWQNDIDSATLQRHGAHWTHPYLVGKPTSYTVGFNWTFFASSNDWVTASENASKLAFVGPLWR